MMKKLLVLSLVLAVVGLASAGLDLSTINGLSYGVAGNTVTISSTAPVSGYLFALKADNGSALSGAVVPAAKFGAVFDNGYNTAGNVWDAASASVGAAAGATGDIFSINFAAGVQKIYFVFSNELGDGSAIGTTYLSSTVTPGIEGSEYFMTVGQIVPEPMTMGLLGLGALFLRKRK